MEDDLRRQLRLEVAEPHAVAAAAVIAAVIGDGDDVTGVGLHGGRAAVRPFDNLCPAAAVAAVRIQRLAAILHLHAALAVAAEAIGEGQLRRLQHRHRQGGLGRGCRAVAGLQLVAVLDKAPRGRVGHGGDALPLVEKALQLRVGGTGQHGHTVPSGVLAAAVDVLRPHAGRRHAGEHQHHQKPRYHSFLHVSVSFLSVNFLSYKRRRRKGSANPSRPYGKRTACAVPT